MTDLVILPIDIPTLALSRGLMQMMLAGLLIFLGGHDKDARGARYWAIGFLLNGISLFVFTIQVPRTWEPPTTVINHLALGASSAFFLIGFWQFGKQPRRLWMLVLLLAIPAGSLLAWELIWPNSRLRVLCTASGQVLFLIALQHSLRAAPHLDLVPIYRRLRVVVHAYVLIFVWSYASIANVLPTSARLDIDYHRTLFSVASLLFMLSMAVGCLALQFAWLAARSADLAMIDWQTRLLNRRGFFGAAHANYRQQNAAEGANCFIALDIDHFKKINDYYGHASGDRVLLALGDRLRELTKPGHLVARMGGEEFCVLLPDCDLKAASDLAERICASCRDTTVAADDGVGIRFTVSAGVCQTQAPTSLEQGLARADEALYAAKRNGRDQVALGAVIEA